MCCDHFQDDQGYGQDAAPSTLGYYEKRKGRRVQQLSLEN